MPSARFEPPKHEYEISFSRKSAIGRKNMQIQMARWHLEEIPHFLASNEIFHEN